MLHIIANYFSEIRKVFLLLLFSVVFFLWQFDQEKLKFLQSKWRLVTKEVQHIWCKLNLGVVFLNVLFFKILPNLDVLTVYIY